MGDAVYKVNWVSEDPAEVAVAEGARRGDAQPAARRSAWIVNVGAVAVALIAAGAML